MALDAADGKATPVARKREGAGLALVACVLSLAMNWPLPAKLADHIPVTLGDAVEQAWVVAWGGHALLHQPLDYFQANAVWPFDNSLAFSDALVGYAPTGLVGGGAQAALLRYNLLFLFAYALAFLGVALLARELGVRPVAAVVAGAAFAYAPWRLAHNGHLNVLSSGGIPLALFLLVRGYRRRQPGAVVAGWAVAAWQVSLGFNLGLQLLYLLASLALVAAVVWLWRGRPALNRTLVRASGIGVAILLLASGALALPYLEVARELPEAKRTLAELAEFSPPPEGLLTAPPESYLWGGATEGLRESFSWPVEQTLFPGAIVLVLALLGLASGPYSPRLRAGLAFGVVLTAVLSLGVSLAGGRFTYRLLYDFAPGWQGPRTPGRITTLTTLGLALLAAAGAHAASARLRSQLAQRAVVLVLATAILVEGAGRLPLRAVPPPPAAQRGALAPQLHLPTDDFIDLRYVYWSTEGFPQLVNGEGSFIPKALGRLRVQVAGFPDRASIRLLRTLGVRTVVLHPELARGTPWQDAARRSVRGLPLARSERGGLVLYRIEPAR